MSEQIERKIAALRQRYQEQNDTYEKAFEEALSEIAEQLFQNMTSHRQEVDGLIFYTALKKALEQFVVNDTLTDFTLYFLRVYKNDIQKEKGAEAFASKNGTGVGYQSMARRYNQMYKKIVQICNAIGQDVEKLPKDYIEMLAEQLSCKTETVLECLEKMQNIRMDLQMQTEQGEVYELPIADEQAENAFDRLVDRIDGTEEADRYAVLFEIMADMFGCAKVKVRQRLMSAFTNELMLHLHGIESVEMKKDKVMHIKESRLSDYQEKIVRHLQDYEEILFDRLIDVDYAVYTLVEEDPIRSIQFLTYGVLRENRSFRSGNLARYWNVANSAVTDFMNHHYKIVKEQVLEQYYGIYA